MSLRLREGERGGQTTFSKGSRAAAAAAAAAAVAGNRIRRMRPCITSKVKLPDGWAMRSHRNRIRIEPFLPQREERQKVKSADFLGKY
ncbi:hypothetical protein BO79DRAFT_64076 [Aspergillus costaricaensis CBS 115574]|uniref:Uncharacterized protein n=1 Tax=Aspergillus costaricaensis CBS 115574 TaxID=1448317 RepID=A0ACD1IPJ6_9EURO|nr:hypothetical protein BO79DRAFT_64076 [Aspergillus costaricaensis CBS 115574]RAK92342.1 hypothetical protein BO79DRAFT_64076 [Aspergillus costaricaensis CBS 115574]